MMALLWKDGRLVLPLSLLVMAAVLLINTVVVGLAIGGRISPSDMVEGSTLSLFVCLSLVALGTPLMLISNEFESGAASWQRSMPVGPHRWMASKMVVTIGLLVGTVLVASVGTQVCVLIANSWGAPVPDWRFWPVVSVMAGGFGALTLVGFIVALVIRHPIAAVFTSIFGFVAVMIVTGIATNWLVRTLRAWKVNEWSPSMEVTAVSLFGLMIAGVGLLVVHLLARRHPDDRWLGGLWDAISFPVDEATTVGSVAHRNGLVPSRTAALTWQNLRTVGWIYLALPIFAVGSMMLISTLAGRDQIDWPVFFVFNALFAGWLGGTTFFADASGGSHRFFADRGVDRLPIFLTRLIPSMISFAATLLISLAIFGVHGLGEQDLSVAPNPLGRVPSAYLFGVVAAVYATSILLTMLTSRPVLGFLAAPMYGCLCMTSWGYVGLESAPAVVYCIPPLSVVVAWFAMRRFLDGERDWKFQGGLTAYLLGVYGMPFLL